MKLLFNASIVILLAVSFSSCSLLVRGGANVARRSIQTAAEAESPTALQQATLNLTAQTNTALQTATANNPALRNILGIRTEAPPQGAEETLCNNNPCFISSCGQFELVSAVGNACTGEVAITLLITQRMMGAPIRHPLSAIIAIDAEGNSYEMIVPTPENQSRSLPQNIPVRATFERIGPVPTSVTSFIYVQAACWNGTFEGGCSPIFRNVPLVWQECQEAVTETDPVIEE